MIPFSHTLANCVSRCHELQINFTSSDVSITQRANYILCQCVRVDVYYLCTLMKWRREEEPVHVGARVSDMTQSVRLFSFFSMNTCVLSIIQLIALRSSSCWFSCILCWVNYTLIIEPQGEFKMLASGGTEMKEEMRINWIVIGYKCYTSIARWEEPRIRDYSLKKKKQILAVT